jgi:hypothetical protein
MQKNITIRDLKAILSVSTDLEIAIVGMPDGRLSVSINGAQLAAARGGIRGWASARRLLEWLHQEGLRVGKFDLTEWSREGSQALAKTAERSGFSVD